MSSIKTNFEMPRGDDPVKQAQRLSQDLSSNFKAITKTLNDLKANTLTTPFGLDGIEFSGTFSGPGSGVTTDYTFTHNFNTVPSGFWCTDILPSSYSAALGILPYYSVVRIAWTTTTITVRIAIETGNAGPCSGSFKILVLR